MAHSQEYLGAGQLMVPISLERGNIRAIHRPPRDFPDPDRFYPDRYLKENRLPYPNEKGYHTFGWGRRGTSFMDYAEISVFWTGTGGTGNTYHGGKAFVGLQLPEKEGRAGQRDCYRY